MNLNEDDIKAIEELKVMKRTIYEFEVCGVKCDKPIDAIFNDYVVLSLLLSKRNPLAWLEYNRQCEEDPILCKANFLRAKPFTPAGSN